MENPNDIVKAAQENTAIQPSEIKIPNENK
jgi:hypothetical protein